MVTFPINFCEFGETELGNLSLNFRRNTVLVKHPHKPRPVPHPLTMAETLHTPSLTLTVLITTLTYSSLPHTLTNSHPHQLTPSPRQSSSSSNTPMCHTTCLSHTHTLTSMHLYKASVVALLSPVMTRTRMPASAHSSMDAFTSS